MEGLSRGSRHRYPTLTRLIPYLLSECITKSSFCLQLGPVAWGYLSGILTTAGHPPLVHLTATPTHIYYTDCDQRTAGTTEEIQLTAMLGAFENAVDVSAYPRGWLWCSAFSPIGFQC